MSKSQIRSQVDAEVGRLQEGRPGAPATKVGLNENGEWEGEDGALSDEDIADLDSLKHAIFGSELASLNDFLQAPLPERPTTGEQVSDFRDYLRTTRTAKARRQVLNRALGPANPDEAPDV
jgi:hypothetical protein